MTSYPFAGQVRIHAERSQYGRGVSLHMVLNGENGQVAVAQPAVMKVLDEGSMMFSSRNPEPLAFLRMDQAQELIDELWRCGLRPTEGTGSAGSLAATERHLADMKALAFHALKVPATSK